MVELIGFFISLLALAYLFIKQQTLSQHKDQLETDKFAEDHPFKELLESIDKGTLEEVVGDVKRSFPSLPQVKKKKPKNSSKPSLKERQFSGQIENRVLKSSLEGHYLPTRFNFSQEPIGNSFALENSREDKKPRASRLQLQLQHLAKRRDIMIYYEVMSQPKSLRAKEILNL